MTAVYEWNVQAARELIAAGANVHAANKEGWSVLQHAAQGGCVEALRCLLEAGVNVNAAANGETALMLATRCGAQDAARYLIAAGANLRAVNAAGKTALKLAREARDKEMIALLRGAGAKR